MNKAKIHDKVTDVLDYVPNDGSGAPIVPIDLVTILRKFNLRAYNIDFEDPSISGAFDRENRAIYVDRTDPYQRKLFTLAHELGHYFLHDDLFYDIFYRERNSSGKNDIEKEANEFAAELLMPESTIRAYWPVTESIQQLAEIFSVSYSAMEYRLRNLGFI